MKGTIVRLEWHGAEVCFRNDEILILIYLFILIYLGWVDSGFLASMPDTIGERSNAMLLIHLYNFSTLQRKATAYRHDKRAR